MKANKRKKTSLEKFGYILLAIYLFGFWLGVAATHYLGNAGTFIFIAVFILMIAVFYRHFIDVYNTLIDNP